MLKKTHVQFYFFFQVHALIINDVVLHMELMNYALDRHVPIIIKQNNATNLAKLVIALMVIVVILFMANLISIMLKSMRVNNGFRKE